MKGFSMSEKRCRMQPDAEATLEANWRRHQEAKMIESRINRKMQEAVII